MALTPLAIKNAQPQPKAYRLADGRSLYLVAPVRVQVLRVSVPAPRQAVGFGAGQLQGHGPQGRSFISKQKTGPNLLPQPRREGIAFVGVAGAVAHLGAES